MGQHVFHHPTYILAELKNDFINNKVLLEKPSQLLNFRKIKKDTDIWVYVAGWDVAGSWRRRRRGWGGAVHQNYKQNPLGNS